MRVNNKVLEKLDYNRIRERLAAFCHLTDAQEKALNLLPVAEYDQVAAQLQETEEARDLLCVHPSFSVRGSKEIHEYLTRCGHGGMLSATEMADIRDTLRSGRRVRATVLETQISSRSEPVSLRQTEDYSLGRIAAAIVPLPSLEEVLDQSLSEEGEVTDRASAELAGIRSNISASRQRIKGALDQVIRNQNYQKMLQDHVVTSRADRYVVPVKQEYVSSFPGIVHDQSASGATFFVEPMVVVQLGNSLREAIMREKREVERILCFLTGKVTEHLPEIQATYTALIALDFILAKARLAHEMRAEVPEIMHQPQVKLVEARHPLLEGEVVPLTVELGREYDWLVVTGPNTGGKTVALKTLALMVLMTQSGLLIPIGGHSRLGVFRALFADIGDEQSVEQSLSTFSGHMTNVISILAEADGMSLVFFDEIGAGTDPAEGTALATAILEELLARGCRGIATTHYGALKTFAYNTPRVENASVEFDTESLRPTYRLISGIPGRSNAFIIAERLGLAKNILDNAQKHLSERQTEMTHLLESLEESQRTAEIQKKALQAEYDALAQMKTDLKNALNRAEEKSLLLEQKARDQALVLLQEARQESQRIIKEIKTAQKMERREQDQAIERAREDTKRLSERFYTEGRSSVRDQDALRPDQIKPGQKVYLRHLDETGYVVSLPDKNSEVAIQAGILKLNVPLNQISIFKGSGDTERNDGSIGSAEKRGKKAGKANKTANRTTRSDGDLINASIVRSEIDLRGHLVDEAVEIIDKYLDDAVLGGINLISIIHGKGTGALRAGVHKYLKQHPQVAAFRLGVAGEGDSGVTIVELK